MALRRSETPVSRFGTVEVEDLPDDLRERLAPVVERTGFTPNIFRALGRRPAELRAFLDYHDALMEHDDAEPGLSKAERELVVVATSGLNDCPYCVVAHGAVLRLRSKDPQLADHVATHPRGCDLEPRQRAIVDLALALAGDPGAFGEADVQAARDAGLDDEEIWDVGSITALFAASNRLAHLTGLQPNAEFFALGR
ncbi:MAG: pcaC [Marmoricola sp.]|jgi:uncharacterized peroxidase-related enzyme|nr:pcaC [Marmoricola sp.]